MISIKPGVDLRAHHDPMGLAIQILAMVYHHYDCDLTITSGCEGVHSGSATRSSLHYTGKALDFRTSNVPMGFMGFIVEEAKAALGPQFDVVEEPDHLHVEFDPK